MRMAAWGLLASGALGVAIAGARSPERAVQPAEPVGSIQRVGPTDQLMALSCDADAGRQLVTLIDPQTRVMSVYHIDRASGQITLKSVRSVRWDLLMEEFNGTAPLPREIRRLVEHR